jgi:hypothetical protein
VLALFPECGCGLSMTNDDPEKVGDTEEWKKWKEEAEKKRKDEG